MVHLHAMYQRLNDVTMNSGDATSKEIANMQNRLKDTGNLLNQTRQLAAEQLIEADKAYKAAAESLTTVEGLKLPNVDPQLVPIAICTLQPLYEDATLL